MIEGQQRQITRIHDTLDNFLDQLEIENFRQVLESFEPFWQRTEPFLEELLRHASSHPSSAEKRSLLCALNTLYRLKEDIQTQLDDYVNSPIRTSCQIC